jgi:energy-coupling factor transport system permease/ATP-binding protein
MKVAELKNVDFSYDSGKTYVLKNFSFEIMDGCHAVLVGKNGAGKSTLAKLVAGLMCPDAGEVTIFGKACFSQGRVDTQAYAEARRGIAYVSQDPTLQLLCENVVSDIAFSPQNLNWDVNDIDSAVLKQLEKAGLSYLAERDPQSLSGGEQQLVSLACAIATDPKLLVLDEPTSFLDENNTSQFLRLLEKTKGKRTILHVTHKQKEIDMADCVVRL